MAEATDAKIQKVHRLLSSYRSVFLTGIGGSGKSYLLKSIYARFVTDGIVIAKCGSTGVAAENIGGVTIHSWSGIQLGDKDVDTHVGLILQRNKKAVKRWRSTQILIIDEISMLGGELFTKLDLVGRRIRRDPRPFGGLTICICGDVCQLEPVKGSPIFTSSSYEEMNFAIVRLTHPWRFHGDPRFFELLMRARYGNLNDEDISLLTERKTAYEKTDISKLEIQPTRLFSRKVDVNEMNLRELSRIRSEPVNYVCSDHIERKTKEASGKVESYESLMDKNIQRDVTLKVGAQVMLTWNLDVEKGLCNGSRGVVLFCGDEYVTVKFKCGEINVFPNAWSIEDEDHIFTRYQIPLILAWCLTIHKSQSSTLDSVVVDLGRDLFSTNMGYVALSRCRSIDGLYIKNLDPSRIKCDQLALEFDLNLVETDD